MTRVAVVVFLATLAVPAFAKTHKYNYEKPCAALWPAVKDTLRNSGKYGIIGIDSSEMTASYNIGGVLGGKRINSLVLNTIPTGCELQVQTAFSGIGNDDAGDLKKRVDASIEKLAGQPAKPEATPAAAKPESPSQL